MWEVLASLGVLAGANRHTSEGAAANSHQVLFACSARIPWHCLAHCRFPADAHCLCDVSKSPPPLEDDDDDADHGGSCLPRA